MKKTAVRKKTVVVLFGGKSVEHDISIITGTQLANALNKDKFRVLPIYISKENEWFFSEKFFEISHFCQKDPTKNAKRVGFLRGGGFRGEELNEGRLRGGGFRGEGLSGKGLNEKVFRGKGLNGKGLNGKSFRGEELNEGSFRGGELVFLRGKKWKTFERCDFVFVALHGNHGENGGVQGLLEMCGVPYSSPGVFGSAVCMNKLATKFVCQMLEINVVKHKIIFERDFRDKMPLKKQLEGFRFPLIVKPNNLGSSIGISFCENFCKLKNALSFAFLFDGEVLVEEAVENLREFNLAVLGNRFSCELSQIEEVCVEKNFLTFENKYLENKSPGLPATSRIIPAKMDKTAQEKIRKFGEKIFLWLGLKGIVRIDFLMNGKSGEIFLNEVNSVPGSFACYLFKNKYNYEKLLQRVMDCAIEEHEREKKKVVKFSSSVIENFSQKHPFVAKTRGEKFF